MKVIKPPKILKIKSDTSELKKVEVFLKETFIYYQLAENEFNRVLLCVSEAVINSIEHGNKFDNNKTVSLEVVGDNNELNVIVRDEGEGYDITKLANPTLKHNIKKESGRGIHIIKSYSDKIEVNKNESLIRFKISYK